MSSFFYLFNYFKFFSYNIFDHILLPTPTPIFILPTLIYVLSFSDKDLKPKANRVKKSTRERSMGPVLCLAS